VHNLGQTRSCKRHNFFILTPDTFVRTVLPGMKACCAIVHVSPAAGAKFAQYTAEFESGGELGGTHLQRFIYVLEGNLQLQVDSRESELGQNAYAYLPEGSQHRIAATRASRAAGTASMISAEGSGALPADHTYPGPGGIQVTSPNQLISPMVAPNGTCK